MHVEMPGAPTALNQNPQGTTRDSALDWPLSQDEKKAQIMRLYNEDVRAADRMLSSGEQALEALRDELEAVRQAAGVSKAVKDTLSEADEIVALPKTIGIGVADLEVERLRSAVASAAAVLRAIAPIPEDSDTEIVDSACWNARGRARSEGAERDRTAAALRPALCQTPRSKSREGKARRVSFGRQPEEEPPNVCQLPQHSREEGPLFESRAGGSIWRVHAFWLVCVILVALGLGFRSSVGPRSAPTATSTDTKLTVGDPACWTGGYKPEICCIGAGGNPACWDATHSYYRCCTVRKTKEL
eukprot:TRINITY_DN31595_c0_g1_i1.p1 TRINITY_DN31595_c0_g1~~TRINITY_DN31595_c0_g1_i1.p1  ORF type:complete len:301 (-),score=39.51 TRINITY_DN31595_c0_g1_i1:125-1027(-)